MASDITQMRQQLNTSWPILIDKDEQFASTLPDGVSDSVVIVDKAMHVTYSKTPVAYSDDISDAIDEIPSGGSQNLGAYFSLIIGPGLFLFFIAYNTSFYMAHIQPTIIQCYIVYISNFDQSIFQFNLIYFLCL